RSCAVLTGRLSDSKTGRLCYGVIGKRGDDDVCAKFIAVVAARRGAGAVRPADCDLPRTAGADGGNRVHHDRPDVAFVRLCRAQSPPRAQNASLHLRLLAAVFLTDDPESALRAGAFSIPAARVVSYRAEIRSYDGT